MLNRLQRISVGPYRLLLVISILITGGVFFYLVVGFQELWFDWGMFSFLIILFASALAFAQ